MRVTRPQAKECWKSAETKGGWGGFFPRRPQKKHGPEHLDLDSIILASRTIRNAFLLFQATKFVVIFVAVTEI